MLRSLAAVMMIICSTASTSAQWITQEQGGAFDNDPLQISLTARGNYALGLRCKSNQSEMLFITKDRSFDRSTAKMANVTSPKLLIRVDRGEIIRLEGKVDIIDGDAVVVADAGVEVYRSIGAGRKSVEIAIEMIGTLLHETSFGVSGSRAAMNSLISKCKLDKRD